MTNNLEAVKEKSLELLKDFKGVIELGDFSRFLLLNFGGNAQGPPKMLAALGIGAHSSLTLSYDPLRGIYFNKILGGNQEQGQVFIHINKSPITDKFLNKNPVKILSSNLSNNEIEAMGIGTKRKKLVHVLASDFQLLESLEQPNGKKIKLAIDLVFSNLKGFIAGYDMRSRVF
ncbi:hypothetical protein GF325_04830, partial [Candidatus Bathyarchaeota archaeon]|nr:hypothetical protein [Candidatus Bathyarchaeota archaeon]